MPPLRQPDEPGRHGGGDEPPHQRRAGTLQREPEPGVAHQLEGAPGRWPETILQQPQLRLPHRRADRHPLGERLVQREHVPVGRRGGRTPGTAHHRPRPGLEQGPGHGGSGRTLQVGLAPGRAAGKQHEGGAEVQLAQFAHVEQPILARSRHHLQRVAPVGDAGGTHRDGQVHRAGTPQVGGAKNSLGRGMGQVRLAAPGVAADLARLRHGRGPGSAAPLAGVAERNDPDAGSRHRVRPPHERLSDGGQHAGLVALDRAGDCRQGAARRTEARAAPHPVRRRGA